MAARDPHAACEHLVFSHANGFPGAVYRSLFEAWAPRYRVTAIDRYGHDPAYPVGRRWPGLARQLVDHVQAQVDPQARLWLVGHSLGGYVSVLAAAELGSRVAGVVLLDSPLIAGLPARLVRYGRRTGLDRFLMPLRETEGRRRSWPDLDAVQAHFANKPGFARWAPGSLRQYVEAGTVAQADGSRALHFDHAVELAIYRSLPTTTVVQAAQRASAPIAFVGGTRSRELRRIGLAATRAVVGRRLHMVEGGHLFPMERPAETAQVVQTLIDAMAAQGRRAA